MKFGWPPTQFVRVSPYEIGYSWELQLHDLKPWLFWLIVLNCQDMLCKFIVKFDKMKQMWLNYSKTNRNYENGKCHTASRFPSCSVEKWKKCQRLNLGISYDLCPMSYSSSFGCYLAFFNFGIEQSKGGKKRLQKTTCTKKGKIL